MYAVITIFEFATEGCPAQVESTYDYDLKVFDNLEDAKKYAKEQFTRSNVDTVMVIPAFYVLSRRG